MENTMIPGELHILNDTVELNAGRPCIVINVTNYGDRPIQIGSHFHFYEVNTALKFNRAITLGFRLNVPSGMAVRFEPGQNRSVKLIQYSGKQKIFGFCQAVMKRLK